MVYTMRCIAIGIPDTARPAHTLWYRTHIRIDDGREYVKPQRNDVLKPYSLQLQLQLY